ncbi:hypothetical protein V8F20_009306 [Naviculisporaceae sp. PSN 640]
MRIYVHSTLDVVLISQKTARLKGHHLRCLPHKRERTPVPLDVDSVLFLSSPIDHCTITQFDNPSLDVLSLMRKYQALRQANSCLFCFSFLCRKRKQNKRGNPQASAHHFAACIFLVKGTSRDPDFALNVQTSEVVATHLFLRLQSLPSRFDDHCRDLRSKGQARGDHVAHASRQRDHPSASSHWSISAQPAHQERKGGAGIPYFTQQKNCTDALNLFGCAKP